MSFRNAILAIATLTFAASIGLRASAAPQASRLASGAAPRSGADVFRAACITCHGTDGTGNPKSHVGFDVPVPDFTDCSATTPEVEHDWFSVVYNGGPIRAFDRHMPSFGEALSEQEIWNVVHYLRSFCTDHNWPHGELNLPRPLITEKAFPENEAVWTLDAAKDGGTSLSNTVIYEHRLWSRTQFELAVPVELQHASGEGWTKGLGDTAFALKHVLFHDDRTIFSVGEETLFPTGKETQGLGGGVTIIEPFLAFGRILPGNGFVQVHSGVELPTDTGKAGREVYWRVAGGRTFYHNRFGRQFSPIVELVAAKDLTAHEAALWDIVPEMQVSLSKLQHVRVSAGLQMPLNEREGRGRTFHLYVLWDWFDGPLFSGW